MPSSDQTALFKERSDALRLRKAPAYSRLNQILTHPELPQAYLEGVSSIITGKSATQAKALLRRTYVTSRRPRDPDPIKRITQDYRKDFGKTIRCSTVEKLLVKGRPALTKKGNRERALNLALGRFGERVFIEQVTPLLSPYKLSLEDVTAKRSSIDFIVSAETPINLNVKSAGVRFGEAKQNLGLTSDECHAIGGYKAIQGFRLRHPLLYVVLTDRDLPVKLFDVWWELLSQVERNAFEHLANLSVSRDLQDAFIEATVDGRIEQILEGLGKGYEDFDFTVISARKVLEIGSQPERIYGLTGQLDGRNIHYSLWSEAQPLEAFCAQHLTSPTSRRKLTAELQKPLPKRSASSPV